jgi:hypothetical protein
MEEALNDLQSWLDSLPVAEVTYYAIFDSKTGQVTGIYPDHAAKDIEHKVLIDREIAESVFEGRTTSHSYIVDLTTANLEFIEVQTLNKIDDVLHRIVNKKWSTVSDNDVFLTYNRQHKTLTFELSIKYNGTRAVENIAPKRVHWSGSTEMLFLLTTYNDPNGLFYTAAVTIDSLIENKKILTNIELPADFSVYTRRLFKNYVIEEI